MPPSLLTPLFTAFGTPVSPLSLGLSLAVLLFCGLAGRTFAARISDRVSLTGQMFESVLRRGGWLVGLSLVPSILGFVSFRTLASLARSVFDARLFDLGDSPVTVFTVIIVVAVVVASFWVSAWARHKVETSLDRQGIAKEGGLAVGFRFGHYLIVVIGLGVGLQTAGVDLSALFAAGAMFAIGVGFAVQTVAQNFVSGVILLVEGAIKPGDVLMLDGKLVRVVQMGIRATVVRNLDDVEIITPNSVLVSGAVENLTMSDKLLRVRVPVGVVYRADPHVAIDVLGKAAFAFEMRQMTIKPVVQLVGFGASSVDFEVSVWIDDPWHLNRVRSSLHLAIWDALKAHDLTIAFPQVDVHFDPELVSVVSNRPVV